MCRHTLHENEAMQDQTKKEKYSSHCIVAILYICEMVSSSRASMPSLPVLNDILREDPVCVVHHVLIVARDVALQKVHGL